MGGNNNAYANEKTNPNVKLRHRQGQAWEYHMPLLSTKKKTRASMQPAQGAVGLQG